MNTKVATTMGPKDWVMLLALSMLWGGSFFFVEVALEALPPLTLVVLRVGMAAVALWIFVLFKSIDIPRNINVWAAFLGMGLLNNVIPFTLIVWGQIEISSGYAAILNATTPLFTVMVASFALPDEKITRLKILGVLFGITGVTVMMGPSILRGVDAAMLAQIAILGAALSYAFASIYGRRFKRLGVDPVLTATGQVTASALVLLPVALIVDQPFTLPAPSAGVWASILALAVFSTACAYILYFRLLSSAGATNLMLVTFLIPVSALLLGVTFLGESLLPMQVLGMAFIGLGLAAIDGRLLKKLSVLE